MLRLINNSGVDLDLGGLDVIPMTYQASAPNKPDVFLSNYSVAINAPVTPNNQLFFGFANIRDFTGLFPYSINEITVIQNGIEITKNSKIVLQKIIRNFLGGDFFQFRVFSGNVNFFDLIKNKSIQDLDLSAFNHTYSATEMQNSQSYDYTDGYIYDIYTRGQLSDLFLNTFNNIFPSIFARTIWEQIFIDSGFDYDFPFGIPNQPYSFDDLLIPFVNKIRPIQNPANYGKNAKGKVVLNSDKLVLHLAGVTGGETSNYFPFIDSDNDFPQYNTNIGNFIQMNDATIIPPYSWTYTRYNCEKGWYLFEVKISIEILVTGGADTAEIGFFVNGTYQGTLKTLNSLDGTDFDFTIKRYIYAPTSGSFNDITIGIGNITSLAITLKTSSIFTAEPVDNNALSLGIWEVAPNLPKIKQIDFIKSIAQIYGLIPQVDTWNNTIKFIPFDKVLDFTRAVDWSEKIDTEETQETGFEVDDLAGTSFCQKNNFKYLANEEITFIADSAINVDNENLQFEQDLITLPFTGIENKLDDFNSLEILQFEQTNTDILDFDKAIYKMKESKPRITVNVTAPVSDFVIYQDLNFEDSLYIADIRRSIFGNLDWENLLNLNWNTLLSILTKAQKEKGSFLLNEIDIQNLDFTRAVWVQKFNAYYYLSKINQFKSSFESVECDLYKLNEV